MTGWRWLYAGRWGTAVARGGRCTGQRRTIRRPRASRPRWEGRQPVDAALGDLAGAPPARGRVRRPAAGGDARVPVHRGASGARCRASRGRRRLPRAGAGRCWTGCSSARRLARLPASDRRTDRRGRRRGRARSARRGRRRDRHAARRRRPDQGRRPVGFARRRRRAPGRRRPGTPRRTTRRPRSGCPSMTSSAVIPRRAAHWVQAVTRPPARTAVEQVRSGAECGSSNSAARPGRANQVDSPVSQSETGTPAATAVAATVNACAQRSGASAPGGGLDDECASHAAGE